MKTIVFQNTRFDVDRFFSKRLAVGLNMKSNRVMNNILTRGVVTNKTLNLIDKFVIIDPLSNNPKLKKRLDVDQSVLDSLKTEITRMAPPHMLMKTTALFGGMDVDRVEFDNDVPLNVSKAVWNMHDSETATDTGAGQCNRAGGQQVPMTFNYRNDIPMARVDLSDNQPMVTGMDNDLSDPVTSSDDHQIDIIYNKSMKDLDELGHAGKLGSLESNQRALDKYKGAVN